MSDEKHYCAAAEMSDTAWEAEKKALDAMGIDGCPPPTDPEDEKLFQQNLKEIAEEKKDNIPW